MPGAERKGGKSDEAHPHCVPYTLHAPQHVKLRCSSLTVLCLLFRGTAIHRVGDWSWLGRAQEVICKPMLAQGVWATSPYGVAVVGVFQGPMWGHMS